MTVLFLRIAAVAALIQFAAHTLMFTLAKPRHGAVEAAVIESMRGHRFDFLGSMRSYWDFYYGYGLEAAAICLVEAVLFWQLATIAVTDPLALRPIIALFLVFNVGHIVLAATYFFLTPMIPDAVIAICLAVAFLKAAG
jgi:hypothetical protein